MKGIKVKATGVKQQRKRERDREVGIFKNFSSLIEAFVRAILCQTVPMMLHFPRASSTFSFAHKTIVVYFGENSITFYMKRTRRRFVQHILFLLYMSSRISWQFSGIRKQVYMAHDLDRYLESNNLNCGITIQCTLLYPLTIG